MPRLDDGRVDLTIAYRTRAEAAAALRRRQAAGCTDCVVVPVGGLMGGGRYYVVFGHPKSDAHA